MASRRSKVVDVTYDDDYRTDAKKRDRRVQEVPWDQIDDIRSRELALFRAPSPQRRDDMVVARRDDRDDNDGDDNDQYFMRRTVTRERFADNDARLAPPRRRQRPRSSRRRTPSPSSSSSESSRERRRRRTRHRRTASAREPSPADSADEHILFWSHKKRCEGNVVERNLDPSYDGIIAGIAGAAIGGITARRFGGEENRGWKMLGGAIAGGLVFNGVENKYRVYTEEREKKKEQAFEIGEPLELAGEAAQNI